VVDDLGRALAIGDHPLQTPTHLIEIRWVEIEEAQTGLTICGNGSQRLIYLMGALAWWR
jgi:hypothetical protein